MRLPDDCTIGYIIEGLLEVKLLHSPLFHSHLENLQRLRGESVLQQVGLSMSFSNNYTSVWSERLNRLNTFQWRRMSTESSSELCPVHLLHLSKKYTSTLANWVIQLSPLSGTLSTILNLNNGVPHFLVSEFPWVTIAASVEENSIWCEKVCRIQSVLIHTVYNISIRVTASTSLITKT